MNAMLASGKMATKRLVLNVNKLEAAKVAAVKFLVKRQIIDWVLIDNGVNCFIFY